jgi:hypothetical protein
MQQQRISIRTGIVLSLLLCSALSAGTNYTGYSGAPLSRGTCASTCHGTTGGTIVVTGFPTVYDPGTVYRITVKHDGGSRIRNFNASVRSATSGLTAGTISTGLFTTTYNVAEEPNGVRLSVANQDSGIFNWTAPNPGVGDVNLYLAGLQGTSMSGPNTSIVLTATQNPTGIHEQPGAGGLLPSLTLESRVVRDYLILKVVAPGTGARRIRILNQSGRRVANISIPTGDAAQTIIWEPADNSGRRLTPGSYFAALTISGQRMIRKFVITR